jgi:acetyl esterase
MARLPTTTEIKALADSSHRWALQRAREAIRLALADKDQALPPLAERRHLSLPGGDGPREARLYRGLGAAADAPLLLYFHGGGFFSGDLDTHEALCVRLADASNLRVLSASYPSPPSWTMPWPLPAPRRSTPRWPAAHPCWWAGIPPAATWPCQWRRSSTQNGPAP